MSNEPLVSVLTPVYNNAEYIAECIESVLKQSYQNFEYIIVNNCSKDRTLEIAQEYARKDSRIKVHDNDTFLGVIDNHNLAFTLISPNSKYTKVCSGDDWLYPECLSLMVELAEANPSVGMVGSYSIAGTQLLWEGLTHEQQVVSGREVCRSTLTGGPYVFGSPTSLLYRSDLLRATKAFYPTANPHSDTSACYMALQHTDFGFVHQVLSYTRVHSGSQTSNSLKSGTNIRGLIWDMAQFGPVYLSEEDLKKNLNLRLDKYYLWLLPAFFEHSMSREFIERQQNGLKEIGFEMSLPRVAKAAATRALEFLDSPAGTVKKISALLKKRGKVTARYY